MSGPNEHPVVHYLTRSHTQSHLLTDGPDETSKFSRDRSDDNRRLLASGNHRAITRTQSDLCLPGDIPYFLGKSDEDLCRFLRDACRILIAPRCFDEHTSSLTVASLRDATPADRPTAGVLGRDETEIAHQQAGRLKATEIAGGCYECRSGDHVNAAQSAQGFYKRPQ